MYHIFITLLPYVTLCYHAEVKIFKIILLATDIASDYYICTTQLPYTLTADELIIDTYTHTNENNHKTMLLRVAFTFSQE